MDHRIGEWINDRTHGQQFKARFLRTSKPSSIEGIEKYVGSGMIRGIGPIYAGKIVVGRRRLTSPDSWNVNGLACLSALNTHAEQHRPRPFCHKTYELESPKCSCVT